MAEGTGYAGRLQIQQQLYGRFCRLCRDLLSSDKYKLYRAWSSTKAGTLLSDIIGEDLSLEAKYASQKCKTCYRRLNTISKQEDDMQKKRQLLSQVKEEAGSFLIARRRFFTEGKRCRTLSTAATCCSDKTVLPRFKRNRENVIRSDISEDINYISLRWYTHSD